MDYYFLIKEVVLFIEKNLFEELSIDSIAEQFGISKYHFQRLFKSATDQNIMSYIRNRRLSEVLVPLKNENMQIIDAAYLCGFNSREAFTRAFAKTFMITPGEYIKNDQDISPTPPLNLLRNDIMHRANGHLIDFEEVQFGPCNLVGYSTNVAFPDFDDMVKTWNTVIEHTRDLPFIKNPHIHFTICKDDFPQGKYSFIAAIETMGIPENPAPLVRFTIPRSKYIAFYHKGKTINYKTMGADEVIDIIFTHFLTRSEYELDPSALSLLTITDDHDLHDDTKDSHLTFMIPVK